MIGNIISHERFCWLTQWRCIQLFYLLLTCPLILLGQTPPIKFERLSYEQGHSQNAIYCTLQDRQGFMWFGTENGLNKYAGYKFTVYKNDTQDSTSISDNWITSLFEDHRGTLWVGTSRGGLNRFDRDKEQFTRFSNDPMNPNSLSSNVVGVIYEDRAGTLWIGTALGSINLIKRKSNLPVLSTIPTIQRVCMAIQLFQSTKIPHRGTYSGLERSAGSTNLIARKISLLILIMIRRILTVSVPARSLQFAKIVPERYGLEHGAEGLIALIASKSNSPDLSMAHRIPTASAMVRFGQFMKITPAHSGSQRQVDLIDLNATPNNLRALSTTRGILIA